MDSSRFPVKLFPKKGKTEASTEYLLHHHSPPDRTSPHRTSSRTGPRTSSRTGPRIGPRIRHRTWMTAGIVALATIAAMTAISATADSAQAQAVECDLELDLGNGKQFACASITQTGGEAALKPNGGSSTFNVNIGNYNNFDDANGPGNFLGVAIGGLTGVSQRPNSGLSNCTGTDSPVSSGCKRTITGGDFTVSVDGDAFFAGGGGDSGVFRLMLPRALFDMSSGTPDTAGDETITITVTAGSTGSTVPLERRGTIRNFSILSILAYGGLGADELNGEAVSLRSLTGITLPRPETDAGTASFRIGALRPCDLTGTETCASITQTGGAATIAANGGSSTFDVNIGNYDNFDDEEIPKNMGNFLSLALSIDGKDFSPALTFGSTPNSGLSDCVDTTWSGCVKKITTIGENTMPGDFTVSVDGDAFFAGGGRTKEFRLMLPRALFNEGQGFPETAGDETITITVTAGSIENHVSSDKHNKPVIFQINNALAYKTLPSNGGTPTDSIGGSGIASIRGTGQPETDVGTAGFTVGAPAPPPSGYTLTALEPANNLLVGGDAVSFWVRIGGYAVDIGLDEFLLANVGMSQTNGIETIGGTDTVSFTTRDFEISLADGVNLVDNDGVCVDTNGCVFLLTKGTAGDFQVAIPGARFVGNDNEEVVRLNVAAISGAETGTATTFSAISATSHDEITDGDPSASIPGERISVGRSDGSVDFTPIPGTIVLSAASEPLTPIAAGTLVCTNGVCTDNGSTVTPLTVQLTDLDIPAAATDLLVRFSVDGADIPAYTSGNSIIEIGDIGLQHPGTDAGYAWTRHDDHVDLSIPVDRVADGPLVTRAVTVNLLTPLSSDVDPGSPDDKTVTLSAVDNDGNSFRPIDLPLPNVIPTGTVTIKPAALPAAVLMATGATDVPAGDTTTFTIELSNIDKDNLPAEDVRLTIDLDGGSPSPAAVIGDLALDVDSDPEITATDFTLDYDIDPGSSGVDSGTSTLDRTENTVTIGINKEYFDTEDKTITFTLALLNTIRVDAEISPAITRVQLDNTNDIAAANIDNNGDSTTDVFTTFTATRPAGAFATLIGDGGEIKSGGSTDTFTVQILHYDATLLGASDYLAIELHTNHELMNGDSVPGGAGPQHGLKSLTTVETEPDLNDGYIIRLAAMDDRIGSGRGGSANGVFLLDSSTPNNFYVAVHKDLLTVGESATSTTTNDAAGREDIVIEVATLRGTALNDALNFNFVVGGIQGWNEITDTEPVGQPSGEIAGSDVTGFTVRGTPLTFTSIPSDASSLISVDVNGVPVDGFGGVVVDKNIPIPNARLIQLAAEATSTSAEVLVCNTTTTTDVVHVPGTHRTSGEFSGKYTIDSPGAEVIVGPNTFIFYVTAETVETAPDTCAAAATAATAAALTPAPTTTAYTLEITVSPSTSTDATLTSLTLTPTAPVAGATTAPSDPATLTTGTGTIFLPALTHEATLAFAVTDGNAIVSDISHNGTTIVPDSILNNSANVIPATITATITNITNGDNITFTVTAANTVNPFSVTYVIGITVATFEYDIATLINPSLPIDSDVTGSVTFKVRDYRFPGGSGAGDVLAINLASYPLIGVNNEFTGPSGDTIIADDGAQMLVGNLATLSLTDEDDGNIVNGINDNDRPYFIQDAAAGTAGNSFYLIVPKAILTDGNEDIVIEVSAGATDEGMNPQTGMYGLGFVTPAPTNAGAYDGTPGGTLGALQGLAFRADPGGRKVAFPVTTPSAVTLVATDAVENGTDGIFTVTLTNAPLGDSVDIGYSIAPANAAANINAEEGTDYTFTIGDTNNGLVVDTDTANAATITQNTGTLTIPESVIREGIPGAAGFTIVVKALEDNIVEGNETVILTLTPIPGVLINGGDTAAPVTMNIADGSNPQGGPDTRDKSGVNAKISDGTDDNITTAVEMAGTSGRMVWVEHTAPVATDITYPITLTAPGPNPAKLTIPDADVDLATGMITVQAGKMDSRNNTDSQGMPDPSTLAIEIPDNVDTSEEGFTMSVGDGVYGEVRNADHYGVVFDVGSTEVTIPRNTDNTLMALSVDSVAVGDSPSATLDTIFAYDITLERGERDMMIVANPNAVGGFVSSISGCRGTDCTLQGAVLLEPSYTGIATDTGEVTHALSNLAVGDANTVNIVVTAENSQTKTYVLTVTTVEIFPDPTFAYVGASTGDLTIDRENVGSVTFRIRDYRFPSGSVASDVLAIRLASDPLNSVNNGFVGPGGDPIIANDGEQVLNGNLATLRLTDLDDLGGLRGIHDNERPYFIQDAAAGTASNSFYLIVPKAILIKDGGRQRGIGDEDIRIEVSPGGATSESGSYALGFAAEPNVGAYSGTENGTLDALRGAAINAAPGTTGTLRVTFPFVDFTVGGNFTFTVTSTTPGATTPARRNTPTPALNAAPTSNPGIPYDGASLILGGAAGSFNVEINGYTQSLHEVAPGVTSTVLVAVLRVSDVLNRDRHGNMNVLKSIKPPVSRNPPPDRPDHCRINWQDIESNSRTDFSVAGYKISLDDSAKRRGIILVNNSGDGLGVAIPSALLVDDHKEIVKINVEATNADNGGLAPLLTTSDGNFACGSAETSGVPSGVPDATEGKRLVFTALHARRAESITPGGDNNPTTRRGEIEEASSGGSVTFSPVAAKGVGVSIHGCGSDDSCTGGPPDRGKIAESGGIAEIEVTLDAVPTSVDVTLPFTITSGNGGDDDDYVVTSDACTKTDPNDGSATIDRCDAIGEMLVFSANADIREMTITVEASPDTEIDADETVTIALDPGEYNGFEVHAPLDSAIITIVDDDIPQTLDLTTPTATAIENVVISEVPDDRQNGAFRVSLTQNAIEDTDLVYTLLPPDSGDAPATEGDDYTITIAPVPGALLDALNPVSHIADDVDGALNTGTFRIDAAAFDAETKTATFDVIIDALHDDIVEGPEKVRLSLTALEGVTLSGSPADITIDDEDDDTGFTVTPVFSTTSPPFTVAEGAEGFQAWVKLDKPLATDFDYTVRLVGVGTTTATTATTSGEAADVTPASATITVQAGKTDSRDNTDGTGDLDPSTFDIVITKNADSANEEFRAEIVPPDYAAQDRGAVYRDLDTLNSSDPVTISVGTDNTLKNLSADGALTANGVSVTNLVDGSAPYAATLAVGKRDVVITAYPTDAGGYVSSISGCQGTDCTVQGVVPLEPSYTGTATATGLITHTLSNLALEDNTVNIAVRAEHDLHPEMYTITVTRVAGVQRGYTIRGVGRDIIINDDNPASFSVEIGDFTPGADDNFLIVPVVLTRGAVPVSISPDIDDHATYALSTGDFSVSLADSVNENADHGNEIFLLTRGTAGDFQVAIPSARFDDNMETVQLNVEAEPDAPGATTSTVTTFSTGTASPYARVPSDPGGTPTGVNSDNAIRNARGFVSFTPAHSDDASLSSLQVNSADINIGATEPAIILSAVDSNEYSVVATPTRDDVSSIAWTVRVNDDSFSGVLAKGPQIDGMTPYTGTITNLSSSGTLTIVVTAADGTTTKDYVVTAVVLSGEPTLLVHASNSAAAEDGPAAGEFIIDLRNALNADTTFSYRIITEDDDSATFDTDYTISIGDTAITPTINTETGVLSGQLTLSGTDADVTLTITPETDTRVENQETVTIAITQADAPLGFSIPVSNFGTVNIADKKDQITVSVDDEVMEGESAVIRFTADAGTVLDRAVSGLQVTTAPVDITDEAAPNVDYMVLRNVDVPKLNATSCPFPSTNLEPGNVFCLVETIIPTLSDIFVEGNEKFNVTISESTADPAVALHREEPVTILDDDDVTATVMLSDTALSEGDTVNASVVLTGDGIFRESVTFTLALVAETVAPGIADGNDIMLAISPMVTIPENPPPVTIDTANTTSSTTSIDIVVDGDMEIAETFSIKIVDTVPPDYSQPVYSSDDHVRERIDDSGRVTLTPSDPATIAASEAASVSLSPPASETIMEGDSAIYTLNINHLPDNFTGDFVANMNVVSGNSTDVDFAVHSSTPPGVTVTTVTEADVITIAEGSLSDILGPDRSAAIPFLVRGENDNIVGNADKTVVFNVTPPGGVVLLPPGNNRTLTITDGTAIDVSVGTVVSPSEAASELIVPIVFTAPAGSENLVVASEVSVMVTLSTGVTGDTPPAEDGEGLDFIGTSKMVMLLPGSITQGGSMINAVFNDASVVDGDLLNDDSIVEGDENLTVTITSENLAVQRGTISNGHAVITDDDKATVKVMTSDPMVREGDRNFKVWVEILPTTPPTTLAISTSFILKFMGTTDETIRSAAADDVAFLGDPPTVTIHPERSSSNLLALGQFPENDDDGGDGVFNNDDDETFQMAINEVQAGSRSSIVNKIITTNSASDSITISNRVSVSIEGTDVTEADTDGDITVGVFTVTLANVPADKAAAFDYAISGTATVSPAGLPANRLLGEDYAIPDSASSTGVTISRTDATTGTLSFAAGTTTGTFNIDVLSDNRIEDPTEDVTITLSISNQDTLDLGFVSTTSEAATITITDKSDQLEISIPGVLDEGATEVPVTFTVAADAILDRNVNLLLSTVAPSGTDPAATGGGVDYALVDPSRVALSSRTNFGDTADNDGMNGSDDGTNVTHILYVPLTIVDDSIVEGNEIFAIAIQEEDTNTAAVTDFGAQNVIINDLDSAEARFRVVAVDAAEALTERADLNELTELTELTEGTNYAVIVDYTGDSTVAVDTTFTVELIMAGTAGIDQADIAGDDADVTLTGTYTILANMPSYTGGRLTIPNTPTDPEGSEKFGLSITGPSWPPGRVGIDDGDFSYLPTGHLPTGTLTIEEKGGEVAGFCLRTTEVLNAILTALSLDPGFNPESNPDPCLIVSEANLNALTALTVSGLSTLKAGDFDDLSTLQTLSLTGDTFTSLPDGVFNELNGLTTLAVSGNALFDLPDNSLNEILDTLTTLTLTDTADDDPVVATIAAVAITQGQSADVTVTLDRTLPVAVSIPIEAGDPNPPTEITYADVVIPAGSSTGTASLAAALTPTPTGGPIQMRTPVLGTTVTDAVTDAVTFTEITRSGGTAVTTAVRQALIADPDPTAPTGTATLSINPAPNATFRRGGDHNGAFGEQAAGSIPEGTIGTATFTITLANLPNSTDDVEIPFSISGGADAATPPVTIDASGDLVQSGADYSLNIADANISFTSVNPDPDGVPATNDGITGVITFDAEALSGGDNAGTGAAEIAIVVADDNVVERNGLENIRLEIDHKDGFTRMQTGSAVERGFEIVDHPDLVTVSVGTTEITEPTTTGAHDLQVIFSAPEGTTLIENRTLTVRVNTTPGTTPGTAMSPDDFVDIAATDVVVTMADAAAGFATEGTTHPTDANRKIITRPVSVIINADSVVEGPEAFAVVIDEPTSDGAIMLPAASPDVTITDTPPTITVSFGATTLNEDNEDPAGDIAIATDANQIPVTFTAAEDVSLQRDVTVLVSTGDDNPVSAEASVDYRALDVAPVMLGNGASFSAGTSTPMGRMLTRRTSITDGVTIEDDVVETGGETFLASITENPDDPAVTIDAAIDAATDVQFTIADNDAAPEIATVTPSSVEEGAGEGGGATVTLDRVLTGTESVEISYSLTLSGDATDADLTANFSSDNVANGNDDTELLTSQTIATGNREVLLPLTAVRDANNETSDNEIVTMVITDMTFKATDTTAAVDITSNALDVPAAMGASYTATGQTAVFMIQDVTPTVELALMTSGAVEGGAAGVFTVNLTNLANTTDNVVVGFTVEGTANINTADTLSGATANNDYEVLVDFTASNGDGSEAGNVVLFGAGDQTITFNGGMNGVLTGSDNMAAASATITITPRRDNVVEATIPETVIFTLSETANTSLFYQAPLDDGTINITDEADVITATVAANAEVDETDADESQNVEIVFGAASGVVTLERPVTVSVDLTAGGATAGDDFTAGPVIVTLGAADNTRASNRLAASSGQPLTIGDAGSDFGESHNLGAGFTIIGDDLVEGDESVNVVLSDVDAAVNSTSGTATIVDDDMAPTVTAVSLSDPTESGGETAVVTITLSRDLTATEQVNVPYTLVATGTDPTTATNADLTENTDDTGLSATVVPTDRDTINISVTAIRELAGNDADETFQVDIGTMRFDAYTTDNTNNTSGDADITFPNIAGVNNVTGFDRTTGVATLTIREGPPLTFSAAPANPAEDGGTGDLFLTVGDTATIPKPNENVAVTVNIGGTATLGTDYRLDVTQGENEASAITAVLAVGGGAFTAATGDNIFNLPGMSDVVRFRVTGEPDTIDDGDETVIITIIRMDYETMDVFDGPQSVSRTVTITDDPAHEPTATLTRTSGSDTVSETGDGGDFEIALSYLGDVSSDVVILYRLTSPAATYGDDDTTDDYTFESADTSMARVTTGTDGSTTVNGSITVLPAALSGADNTAAAGGTITVTIDPRSDGLGDSNETVTLDITMGAGTKTPADLMIVQDAIADNRAVTFTEGPDLAFATVNAAEADTGDTPDAAMDGMFTLTFTDKPVGEYANITFTLDGTATFATDYTLGVETGTTGAVTNAATYIGGNPTASGGAFRLPAGHNVAEIIITTVADDAIDDDDETVEIVITDLDYQTTNDNDLTGLTGASVTRSITIADDPAHEPTATLVRTGNAVVTEAGGGSAFRINVDYLNASTDAVIPFQLEGTAVFGTEESVNTYIPAITADYSIEVTSPAEITQPPNTSMTPPGGTPLTGGTITITNLAGIRDEAGSYSGSAVFTIVPRDDGVQAEEITGETVIVALAAATVPESIPFATPVPAEAARTVTIQQGPTASLSGAASTTIPEGDVDGSPAAGSTTYTLTLSSLTSNSVTLAYEQTGSADLVTDYTQDIDGTDATCAISRTAGSNNGTITVTGIAASDAMFAGSCAITITSVVNDYDSGDETVILALDIPDPNPPADGVTRSNASADSRTITIENDDIVMADIVGSNASIEEGTNQEASFTFRLRNAPNADATVRYDIDDGTGSGVLGTDYSLSIDGIALTSRTFVDGNTFTIPASVIRSDTQGTAEVTFTFTPGSRDRGESESETFIFFADNVSFSDGVTDAITAPTRTVTITFMDLDAPTAELTATRQNGNDYYVPQNAIDPDFAGTLMIEVVRAPDTAAEVVLTVNLGAPDDVPAGADGGTVANSSTSTAATTTATLVSGEIVTGDGNFTIAAEDSDHALALVMGTTNAFTVTIPQNKFMDREETVVLNLETGSSSADTGIKFSLGASITDGTSEIGTSVMSAESFHVRTPNNHLCLRPPGVRNSVVKEEGVVNCDEDFDPEMFAPTNDQGEPTPLMVMLDPENPLKTGDLMDFMMLTEISFDGEGALPMLPNLPLTKLTVMSGVQAPPGGLDPVLDTVEELDWPRPATMGLEYKRPGDTTQPSAIGAASALNEGGGGGFVPLQDDRNGTLTVSLDVELPVRVGVQVTAVCEDNVVITFEEGTGDNVVEVNILAGFLTPAIPLDVIDVAATRDGEDVPATERIDCVFNPVISLENTVTNVGTQIASHVNTDFMGRDKSGDDVETYARSETTPVKALINEVRRARTRGDADIARITEAVTTVLAREQVAMMTRLVRQRVQDLSLARPAANTTASNDDMQVSLAQSPANMQDFVSGLALNTARDMDDGGSYSLWARGQWVGISGSPDIGVEGFNYDGNIVGAGTGVEFRDHNSMYGLALTATRSELDITTAEGASTHEEDMIFAAPYAAWKSMVSGITLWGTVGVGTGSADITDSDGNTASPDVAVFFTRGGADIAERISERVDIVFGMSGLFIDKTVDAFSLGGVDVGETNVGIAQTQADMTVFFDIPAGDGVVRPYFGLASVHDFSDTVARDPHAVEGKAGISWGQHPWSVSVDGFYEFLRNDQKAWGVFGEIGIAQTDGGFRFGLTGNHGTAGSMSDAVTSTNTVASDLSGSLSGGGSQEATWSLGAESSYAFGAPVFDRSGTAAPFVSGTHAESGQTLGTGVRVGLTGNIDVTVESNRNMPSDGVPYSEHAVGLNARWAF